MAVETRFVVVRGGNEIMTFADKKAADEYDRMLDMADNLTALFDNAEIPMDDKLKEDLSIYLAKNREEVLYSLLAKKRPAPAKSKSKPKAEDKPAPSENTANDETTQKTARKRKVAND